MTYSRSHSRTRRLRVVDVLINVAAIEDAADRLHLLAAAVDGDLGSKQLADDLDDAIDRIERHAWRLKVIGQGAP